MSKINANNYCNFCHYRVKKEGKTYCDEQYIGGVIADAMKRCDRLLPFAEYKKSKESGHNAKTVC